ncbi:hypothetical protein ILUMI_21893 [Ignelater luminosus]|uniref:E3 ubiquitin-protein ligase APD1-4 middle domain-containing protein n=1 Tax=Ignelater luminosus TaxID=2038154 RepID=A0A8K0CHU7_IGNLU|nr:hypothetical protein ILUMI_21893 [Ignelater luminosus]
MRGAKRVVIFCIMTTVLPTILIIIPLYLRHIVFADVTYTVAETDVVEITQGISSVFCSAQSLQMNSTFNAFHLNQMPRVSTKRKHIRLKKSMTLPDDTLEYWGFYLLKGATVLLKACSRYEGSRILVVRGERNLRTCGLMEHNLKKNNPQLDQEHNQVKVTFESAQEIEEWNSSRGVNQIPQPHPTSITDAGVEDTSDDDDDSEAKLNIFSKINRSLVNVEEMNHPQLYKHNRTGRILSKTPSASKQGKISKFKSKHKHHNRHSSKKFAEKRQQLYKLQQELQKDEDVKFVVDRAKRDNMRHLFDERIEHGGNAINYTEINSNEDAISSFETDLLTCYNGQILLTEGFPPSHLCTDVHYLENGDRMETVHNIVSDGYYYYIFYSDNDFISNDIHVIFDVYKPTLKFANISETKSCINKTECKFPISFWSDETVIVEVPMKDGIAREGDDITYLVSTCHPRMSVYIIFPVAVMFLILGCAFM